MTETTRNSEKGEQRKLWMKVRTLQDQSSSKLISSSNPRLDLTCNISSEMDKICLLCDEESLHPERKV